jgi:uncharacterized protein with gpF-like domain
MTPAQQAFFQCAHDRIARLSPDVAAALFAALRAIAASLNEAELARLIASGAVDRLITQAFSDVALDREFLRFRAALRTSVEAAFRWNTPYLPRGGKVDGTISVVFDQLNPRVIEAVRTMETRAITSLKESIRETVRQAIERGITDGVAPQTIARGLRDVIGLSPSQEAAVANYRALLESGDREALTRLLRDRRFDATLDRALGPNGEGLAASRIDTMVEAYRRKSVAMNANTITSTAVKDAYKVAQRESWASAVDAGIIEPGRLQKTWIGIGDDRERPGHLIMNNTVVPFDEPYPNGDMYAGEGDPWNCRCLDQVTVARA